MKLALITVFLTVMQTAPPVPRQAADTSAQDAQQLKKNSPSDKQPVSPSPPLASFSEKPKRNEQPPDDKTSLNAEQSIRIREVPPVSISRDWADWILWGASALLTLVGIFGIGLAYSTLNAIKHQTKAVNDSVGVMINSERAWVLVEIGEIPNFQTQPSQLEFLWIRPAIRNYGNTVARIKRIRAIVRLVPDGQALPPQPEYPLGQGADIQGVNLILPPNIPIQPIKLGVTGEEFAQIRQGRIFLYVHGFLEYWDLGHTERRTAFCFFYAIQSGFSPDPTRFYLELTAPPAYNEYT